jgi:hypothetical protein
MTRLPQAGDAGPELLLALLSGSRPTASPSPLFAAMSLDSTVLIDVQDGTFFGAQNAYLLDTRLLDDQQLEILNEGTDSERSDLALALGRDLERDQQALDAVAELLRQPDWSSDTIDAVAELVAATGRELSTPGAW